jgi:hypothetical protein
MMTEEWWRFWFFSNQLIFFWSQLLLLCRVTTQQLKNSLRQILRLKSKVLWVMSDLHGVLPAKLLGYRLVQVRFFSSYNSGWLFVFESRADSSDFLLQFKGKLSFYFLLSHLQHFSDWPYTFMLGVSPNMCFSVCIVSYGSCDIFEKCSQPEYAGIEMIRMPDVHSNI